MFKAINIRLTIILLIQLLAFNSQAQNAMNKDSVIHYLKNSNNLDPIEGIWTLHVVRTLFQNNDSIVEETQYMRSEWAVLRFDKQRFKIIDIGGAEKENSAADFEAYFKKTKSSGLYTYKCKFANPNWSAKSQVILKDDVILEYEYFVSKVYLKSEYKEDYKPGFRLRWRFTWTKQNSENKTLKLSPYSNQHKQVEVNQHFSSLVLSSFHTNIMQIT